MKQQKEIWGCDLGCGEFETQADFVKCPQCQTKRVHLISNKIDECDCNACTLCEYNSNNRRFV